MKLKAYLQMRNINVSAAASELKKQQQTVHFWVSDSRIPRKNDMREIYLWSKGVVQPNDFYDLPEIEDARANGHTLVQMTTGAAA